MGYLKKMVFTLNVDGYAPEITELTYPLLRYYANKIGADFYTIRERKFSDWPVTYEKLQIYELAREMGIDWAIYIDSDALVHPETIDWTAYLPKDTVAHNGYDLASLRWTFNEFFLRDGRSIGCCNWFTVASNWCLDLWHPLDISLKEALSNIHPTVGELNTIITPEHLIDDYTLSRNIARYGLKFKTLHQIQKDLNIENAYFLWHEYVRSTEEKVNGWEDEQWDDQAKIYIKTKVKGIKGMLDQWKIPNSIREYGK